MYTNSGVNKKTDNLFMKEIPTLISDKEKLKKIGELYSKINIYTLKRDKFFKSFALKEYLSDIVYDDENEINHYEDKEFSFDFMLLSDKIDNNRLIKQLKSKKRFHKCHESSIGMCLNDDENNMKILIGYVPCVNTEVLHSVVEMTEDDIKYIIDFTQNLIMEKEDFIKTNCFRVINEVTSEDLKKDKDIICELEIRTPFYLFFRDEINKELKKNIKF